MGKRIKDGDYIEFVRHMRDDCYTQIANAIMWDSEISYMAQGVFLQICSVPKRHFKVSIDGLVAMKTSDGKTAKNSGASAVRAALKALEAHGYIRRIPQYVHNDGKVIHLYDKYIIDDDPKNIIDRYRQKTIEEECW